MGTLSSHLVQDFYGLEDMLVGGGFMPPPVGGVRADSPTISGVRVSNTCTVTIENYISSNFYLITSTSGTYMRTDDTIVWTLPSTPGTYTLSVYTTASGYKLSLPDQIQEVVS